MRQWGGLVVVIWGALGAVATTPAVNQAQEASSAHMSGHSNSETRHETTAALNVLKERTDRDIARFLSARRALLPHERTANVPSFSDPCPDDGGVFWYGSEQLKDYGERLRARQCGLATFDQTNYEHPGWAWAAVLSRNGDEEVAPALAMATAQTKTATPSIGDSWWVLGPVERRADAFGPDIISQRGGAHAIGREAELDAATMGVAHWKPARTRLDGTFEADMRPFWGHIDSNQADEHRTWQGWARGALWVPTRQRVSVGCVGVGVFTLDGQSLPGTPPVKSALLDQADPVSFEPTSWSTTKELEPGLHVLAARITERSGQVGCMLQPTEDGAASGDLGVFDLEAPPFLPDLLEGLLLSGGFTLPITNRHPTKYLRNVKVVVTGRLWSLNQTNPVIPPGQTHLMRVHLTEMPTFTEGGPQNPGGCQVTKSGHVVSVLELRVSAPGFGRRKLPLIMRCRRSLGEPFTFTYVDHRGAAQTAVAIAPQFQCPYFRCAVVVSLRLPTLHPGDQILRHTLYNETAGIRIALQHGWYVTPAWTVDSEDNLVQHRAALESLLLALEMVSRNRVFCFQLDACQIVADSNRVLLEAYGADSRLAILLGASMPDRTLGLLTTAPDEPLPGAISLDTFSEMDFALGAVLRRQTEWRHIERVGHALNGVPILFHIADGEHVAADRARITKLLTIYRRFQVNATVVVSDDRVGSKWWHNITQGPIDAVAPNYEFFGEPIRELLHVLGKSDIQAFTPEYYTIKVTEPLAQGSKGGITVVASCDRRLPATITVDYLFDQVHWSHRGFIHTRNVCEFKFHRPPGLSGSPGGSPFDWTNTSVVLVDGQHLAMDGMDDTSTGLCRRCAEPNDCQWEPCQMARSPQPWGGVSAVIGKGLKVVYGTGGSSEETAAAERAAVLFANWYAADRNRPIPIQVFSDQDLLSGSAEFALEHNERLVLMGTPATHGLMQRARLRLGDSSFDQLFGSFALGVSSQKTVIALVPEPLLGVLSEDETDSTGRSTTALVLAAKTAGELVQLVQFLVEVGSDIPDFMIFGPSLAESALGALELAGHWDGEWVVTPQLVGGPLASCPVQRRIGPQDGAVFCR